MAFTDRVFYRTGAARKSGIWTTTTSSHLSGPGATPITITVADASLFPRGAGVSEDCLLSVCSSENQNTVLDILYDVAISGNSVTCKREYGNAIPEGSIMLVGAPAELLDELKTELSGKEDSFGNPTSDGGVLTSTTGGVRSWVGKDTLPPFLRSEADYIVAASGGDYTTPQALMTALGNYGAVGKKIWVDSTIATPAANQNILSGDWYWDDTACDFDTNQNSLSFRGISRHWGQVAVTGPGAATTANLFVMVESPQIYAEVVINHTRTVPPSAAWRAFETATLRGAYAKLVHIATAPATDFSLISVNAAYIRQLLTRTSELGCPYTAHVLLAQTCVGQLPPSPPQQIRGHACAWKWTRASTTGNTAYTWTRTGTASLPAVCSGGCCPATRRSATLPTESTLHRSCM
jgi:hypothetical protein